MTNRIAFSIAAFICLIAIVGPLWATSFVLGSASAGMFSFTALAFRGIGQFLLAIVPFLLVLYFRVTHQQMSRLRRDIFPTVALFTLISLILGMLYFSDSYTLVMSDNAIGPSIAIGVIKAGDIFIPTTIFFWSFVGAWLFIVQDFLRRIRDGYLSTRAIVSASFRVVLSMATALLFYIAIQTGADAVSPVYEFKVAESREFSLQEDSRRIVRPEGNAQVGRKLEYYTVVPKNNSLVFLLAGLCFLSGMYPRKLMTRAIKTLAAAGGIDVSQGGSLTLIQGLTLEDEERLGEEGFETVQKIATASAEVIAERTQYSTVTIDDWIDQAKLVLYFPNTTTLDEIHQIGIRTYSDLEKLGKVVDKDFAELSAKVPKVDLRLFKV